MKNQDCDRLIDYLEDRLSTEEKKEFETHLQTCTDCQEVIELMGDLPYLSEPAEPSEGMKSRVLGAVFEEEHRPAATERVVTKRKKRNWMGLSLAAVLFVSLLGNIYALTWLTEGTEEAVALEEIGLEPNGSFTGNAAVSIVKGTNEELTLTVEATELEPLQGDAIYQVWLIADGEPMPAGYLSPDSTGTGVALFTLGQELDAWDTVAITREPQYGNKLPEGDIVLSAPL
ncbi:anti-sigma factor [Planococcus lenghuensis]|uniref:Anti-sigma-W factor RsiW n=1 Tax=Planococcus lenghuensis TaxID=2213202 RepID=A0A1Q2L064_9BACL|nr:anti-sigma factor [Planococcus lenghuensis]AQQ53282.1 hypothetical protein B0X71_09445 [Planococcus lenghuensis]